MRGTCRTYILIDARAWITFSTLRASKNKGHFDLADTFVPLTLELPQEGNGVHVLIAAPLGLLTRERDKVLSADCLGLAAQKKTNRYSRMVIFFSYNDFSFSTVTINPVWQFFVLDW